MKEEDALRRDRNVAYNKKTRWVQFSNRWIRKASDLVYMVRHGVRIDMGTLFLVGHRVKEAGEKAIEHMENAEKYRMTGRTIDGICLMTTQLELMSSKLYDLCSVLEFKPKTFPKFVNTLEPLMPPPTSEAREKLDELLEGLQVETPMPEVKVIGEKVE